MTWCEAELILPKRRHGIDPAGKETSGSRLRCAERGRLARPCFNPQRLALPSIPFTQPPHRNVQALAEFRTDLSLHCEPLLTMTHRRDGSRCDEGLVSAGDRIGKLTSDFEIDLLRWTIDIFPNDAGAQPRSFSSSIKLQFANLHRVAK